MFEAYNTSMNPFVIVIAIYVASIVLCHYIAKRRGAKPVFWGIMGALFGPIAVPFVFFAKPKTK